MKAPLLVAVSLFCVFGALFAGPSVGIGQSGLADARAAGSEAAQAAKSKLAGVEAKVVLVFAARAQLTPEVVAGVAGVFDKSIIYGCEGYASLGPEGNFSDRGHSIPSGVSVMGIGGDIDIHAVAVAVVKPADKALGADNYLQNGKEIGQQLSSFWKNGDNGQLIITFGDQHVGNNQPYVDGVKSVLGEAVRMVGAAAGGHEAREIVRGEVVTGTNVAILMRGGIRVVTAAGSGSEVPTADAAFKQVLAGGKSKPLWFFVFDCGGRRGNMFKAGTLQQEWQAMKDNAGSVPFFGFYGGGEIGHKLPDSTCLGIGYHIAIAAIYPTE